MTDIRLTIDPEGDPRSRLLAVLDAEVAKIGHSFTFETRSYEAWEDQVYLGGLLARFATAWVFVELLAVTEAARGKGMGRDLMARMEADAAKSGKSGIWLDTFSFQAPEFYRRLGYEEFGTIPDYLGTSSRHFFAKRLEG